MKNRLFECTKDYSSFSINKNNKFTNRTTEGLNFTIGSRDHLGMITYKNYTFNREQLRVIKQVISDELDGEY